VITNVGFSFATVPAEVAPSPQSMTAVKATPSVEGAADCVRSACPQTHWIGNGGNNDLVSAVAVLLLRKLSLRLSTVTVF
jgi:hypothetical protein